MRGTMAHRVDFCSHWDNPFVLDYNRYYLCGLSKIAHLTSSTESWYVKPLSDLAAKVRISRMVMQHVYGRLGARYPSKAQYYVGRYVFDTGDRRIRFAIDPHDNRKIASGPIFDWCDVYFKSNKWVSEKYPSKVLPLVNGNGLHSRRTLSLLRSLRHTPKEYDFVMISRLGAGVEHNLKVFESLSRLRCRKLLIAILYSEHGHDTYAKRLEGYGVTCIRRNLPPRELWSILARSRVNFLRLGAKYCIPWRMIDLLCMGACVVLDRYPCSDWPVPLENLVNFMACFNRSAAPGEESDYARVAKTVEHLLDSPEHVRAIAANNATYFDRFAAPTMVANYIVESLLSCDALDLTDVTWSDAGEPWPDTDQH